MKWFEHQTTDKDSLEARLIRKRFGNEGWGVWQNLMEVIGQNMGNDNVDEWGCVAGTHTMKSLADACYCSLKYFEEFITYCDELTILGRKNGRLFCPFILERMNEYAARLEAKKKREKRQDTPDNPESTKSPESTEKQKITESTENPYGTKTTESSASQHNTPQSQHNTKNINTGDAPPRPATHTPTNPLPGPSGSEPRSNGEPEHKPKGSGGPKAIGDVLASRVIQPAAQSGITKPWQDKAFRYAEKLGIDLTGIQGLKARWLRVFKQADEGRKAGNLEQAYRYLVDYTGNLTDEEKVNYFFSIYEHGLNRGGSHV